MSRAQGGLFEVSREGLRKLVRRRGMAFVIHELVQNAWDSDATRVLIRLEPIAGQAACMLVVEDDDADGFRDFSHAWTFFAESEKKLDVGKRGRFNIGEKLVIAACDWAEIHTTKGKVRFDGDERSEFMRPCDRRERGTVFTGKIGMTRHELREVETAVRKLLPPIEVETTFNGDRLRAVEPLKVFEVALPTEKADEEGYLRPTVRRTTVRVHARREGASSMIFEMGIPVVETEDPWSIEVLQKIPLNSDRDGVTPGYHRELRVAVVNAMHEQLSAEDAASPAVQDALSDADIEEAAVRSILTKQFGEKRAVFDMSDREANAHAFNEGFAIIPGSAFTKKQWSQIRRAEAAAPAGRIFPSPKFYSEGGEPMKIVSEEDWTPGMRNIADYAGALAQKLIKRCVSVQFEKGRMTAAFAANYGAATLTFNLDRLGKKWFDRGPCESVNDLLIHELSHEYGSHLTDEFDHALSRLGAKMVTLALVEPEFFKKFEGKS